MEATWLTKVSVKDDGGGHTLATADAVVCVGGTRLTKEVSDGGDGGDGAD